MIRIFINKKLIPNESRFSLIDSDSAATIRVRQLEFVNDKNLLTKVDPIKNVILSKLRLYKDGKNPEHNEFMVEIRGTTNGFIDYGATFPLMVFECKMRGAPKTHYKDEAQFTECTFIVQRILTPIIMDENMLTRRGLLAHDKTFLEPLNENNGDT